MAISGNNIAVGGDCYDSSICGASPFPNPIIEMIDATTLVTLWTR